MNFYRDFERCASGAKQRQSGTSGIRHAVSLLCVLLLACTGSAVGNVTQQHESQLEAAVHADNLVGEASQPSAIQVYLTEFNLEIVVTDLPAGVNYFRVTNASSLEHNFEIERSDRPGNLISTNLQPGESKTVKVHLHSGLYLAYWPVPGIGERGYPVELHVTDPALTTKDPALTTK